MSFFRRKRLFTILISLIILVGLIGYSLSNREELSSVEEFIQDTVGSFQNVLLRPVYYVRDVIGNIDEMKQVYEENQQLKENLSTYQQKLYEVQELTKENEELKAVLDKTETMTDYRPIQATVIARSPEQWFNQVTLNKGKQHGVEKDMAVITASGMIGKIQSSAQFTSTVLLLNGFDRSNRISVNVDLPETETDAKGFILGYDDTREQLLLEFTDSYEDIPLDTTVFSSGLGGVFPKGLEIGSIEEVTTDQYGLTQIAYVKPSADIEELNHVIVVDRLLTSIDEVEESGDE
ncbi:cell shape-determining protein MreC [Halolactibacillus miurensis]|uniref:Cell shape-determining protein MreC n=1 Tax=Halolactibacillus miurensis TaxID=306541 RepID=A0A1I6PJN9_9BACI|nr:rod shape-determining protein MreC [Halolactibacillus miurensis]GEM03804.1 cell shape-determining protein MreC [Halolactibacillus miurensis]SFS40386.1 rod shape-determining protein MreC [Halolactibacillus miurensis]